MRFPRPCSHARVFSRSPAEFGFLLNIGWLRAQTGALCIHGGSEKSARQHYYTHQEAYAEVWQTKIDWDIMTAQRLDRSLVTRFFISL